MYSNYYILIGSLLYNNYYHNSHNYHPHLLQSAIIIEADPVPWTIACGTRGLIGLDLFSSLGGSLYSVIPHQPRQIGPGVCIGRRKNVEMNDELWKNCIVDNGDSQYIHHAIWSQYMRALQTQKLRNYRPDLNQSKTKHKIRIRLNH